MYGLLCGDADKQCLGVGHTYIFGGRKMSNNKNEHLVTAVFDSKDKAAEAAQALKGWDKANEDIKLGAISVLTKNEKGKVETTNYSSRQTGKGAKIGVIVGAITALLSGGITLLGGVIGGAVLGGIGGSLSKLGLGLSEDDLKALAAELDAGHAALLVMCDDSEVEATTAELTTLGGKTQSKPVSDEAVQQAEQALATAAEKGADESSSSETAATDDTTKSA
jgi:uncharacterized membrane protein